MKKGFKSALIGLAAFSLSTAAIASEYKDFYKYVVLNAKKVS